MSNLDVSSNVTGTSLAALAPDSVRKLWKKGALIAEQGNDFYQPMEGRSEKSLIWTNTDLSKGNGHEITFTTQSGFYNEGKVGEALFEGPDDFESVDIDDFKLKVDFVRNAVRMTERTEEVMGMRGEIASGFNVQLGEWLGRKKTEQINMMIMLKINAENVMCANGKTPATLSSADVLTWDDIVTAGQSMKPLGGLPANISAAGVGYPIWSQTIVATEAALTSLKLDSDYKTALQNADVRGRGNTIFKGGYLPIDGHTIVPFNPIDHDGIGAVGSPLNPKAFLGVAITDADTAVEVKGGGNATDAAKTGKLYFKYFPGYAYTFIDTGAYSVSDYPSSDGVNYDAEEKYFLIYNLTGADAGKFGMYAYTTGNNGNKITITKRLTTGSEGTYQKNTVGGVVYNASPYTGKVTMAHPVGSLIIPCNRLGVPIADTVFFGRSAICRGYGMYRAERVQEEHNLGFVTDRGIVSVFGQTIRQDRKGRHPALIRLRHAVSYPGISLPVVA
jgi:hypothetical protein